MIATAANMQKPSLKIQWLAFGPPG